ncbi:stage II sporulation protein M [Staphylococcus chromogenes]|uniref:stage II sporulation protein M n=1 Tax=Staphylococcus chromogenes TaxID=46126 RepID=UPI00164444CE|nr:stage II sporulation protein M [Staphylococcus chromogenes]
MNNKIFGIFVCISFLVFSISLIFGVLLSQPSSKTVDYDLNFLDIFMKNLLVCVILIIGFFSLGIISLILLSINSGIFGAIFRQYYDDTSFNQFILSILPHGIFEVPALLISAAIGMSSWLYIFQYIFNQRISIKKDSRFFCKVISFVVILLLIGALIETFVTIPLNK